MNVNQLVIKSIVDATTESYSLMVVKKDGTWGDSAIVHYGGKDIDIFEELKKASKIIERDDLKLDIMTVADGKLIIGLREV